MSKKASHSFDSPTRTARLDKARENGRGFAFAKKPADQKSQTENYGFLPAAKPTVNTVEKFPDNLTEQSAVKSAANFAENSADAENIEPTTKSSSVAAVSPKPKKTIERWLARRGHSVTFVLLFAFTVVLYFRPYELIPSLAGLSSIAWFLAIGTILVFIPSQFAVENTFTARPAEVNYVLLLAGFALVSIVVARDRQEAWNAFNDPFVKVVLIFIVMVNVIRTKKRLLAMMWLSLAVGVMLAWEVLQVHASGKSNVEGYRSMAEIKGVFGNPNAQSLHFVMMLPIAVALGIAARNFFMRAVYFLAAAAFVAGNMVTFSRGGFLGLMIAAGILAWKLGRKNRWLIMTASAVAGALLIALAPGGYGVRVLSIFLPGLDPVGSSHQRSDLLKTSLLVTVRNPWGIGIGNFPLANPHGLVTHNSFTQVSAELGILALVVYVLFHYEPMRRLFWIERELAAANDYNWFYYLSIGLQASFAAWIVGSFFDAAAFQWFLYYLAAYAICLRRVYQISRESESRESILNDSRLSTLRLSDS